MLTLVFVSVLVVLLVVAVAEASSSTTTHSNSVPTTVTSPNVIDDCAVVGVGDLGTNLCRQILQETNWNVAGITRSTKRHETILRAMPADQVHRLTLATRDSLPKKTKFNNVVFCAPPLGPEDYSEAIKDAAENIWKGPDEATGIFCLTSSGGVYTIESGIVTESTIITDINPRAERLIHGERACAAVGGCSLRLAGLYNYERGAHAWYLKHESDDPMPGNPNGLINLLHYDDAAASCLAALKAGPSVCQGRIFLISDGRPLSRRKICEIAAKCPAFSDCRIPKFVDDGLPGKQYDGTVSNQALQWQPQHESFGKFMEEFMES